MKNIRYYLDLLWAMSEREVKGRYKRAFFGFLWVILNPVLQMVVIGMVLSFFIKIPNYFTFLFIGLLPWQFFSLSLSKATPSFVNERSLLQKAKFPLETIPLSIVLANFFHMLIAFSLLLPILFISGHWPGISVFLVVPILIWLFIVTTGLCILSSSLNVRFRDIAFFVQTLLTLGFYATPIIYSLGSIPTYLQVFMALNPLAAIFELLHAVLLGVGHVSSTVLTINIVVTIFIVILAWFVFRKHARYFVDWL